MFPVWKSALAALCISFPLLSQTAPPDVSLAVNGAANAEVYAGWPILLQATIAITDDAGTATFNPLQASVQLYDASGAALPVTFTSYGGQTDDITLNADNDIAGFRFYLTPDQTAALSGSYQVTFTLGDLTAKSAFTVSAEPTPSPEGLESTKRLAMCDFYLASGGYQQALDLANLELAVNASSLPALSLAASALEGLGRKKEAIAALAKALAAFKTQFPAATEPPKALQQRYANLIFSGTGAAN